METKKEKKTILKMLFSKVQIRSCAKVLNYFTSPSRTEKLRVFMAKKTYQNKMANERIILELTREQL
jgi:hypothetical protein